MKITKTNSILRFTCALLAVLTVVVSLPLFAIEGKAEDTATAISHSFDFSGGTLGSTIAAGGYVNSPGTAFTYAEKDGKIVAKGTNGQFSFNKDVPLLADTKFFIELRLNVTSIGTSQLSLIALTLKTSETATSGTATPLVRLNHETKHLEMRDKATSSNNYIDTGKEMTLNEWHTVKVVVDDSTRMVDLFLDGDYVYSLSMRSDLKYISNVRIMHSSKTWGGYIDSVSYGTFVAMHNLAFSDKATTDTFAKGNIIDGVNIHGKTGTINYVVKDGKTVLYGSDGRFSVDTDVPKLVDGKYFVEIRFNIEAVGTSEMSFIGTGANSTVYATLRLKPDGSFEMRNSATPAGYEGTPATVKKDDGTYDGWHTVKLVVDVPTSKVDFYFDTELAYSITTATINDLQYLRFMQEGKGGWKWYIDTISYGVFVEEAPEEPVEPEKPDPILDPALYNEYISFDSFAAGDTVTSDALLATETVSADRIEKVSYLSGVKVKADPDNAENMASYNTENEYCLALYEKTKKLAATSFVASMDVRFSSFPVEASSGADKPTSLLAWAFGSSSAPSYMIFCRVDSKGNLINRQNELTGFAFELEEWTNVAVLCDGTTGEYDVFFNGEYVFSDDIGSPKTTNAVSYIRVLNRSQGAKFSVCVDDVMLYEAERIAPAEEANVIWDVDFEDLAVGTQMSATTWNELSDVADAFETANSSVFKVAEFKGSNALKVTNGTDISRMDLYMGKNEFDPLRTDGLSFKFDFAIENFSDTADETTGEYAPSGTHHIVSWRRLNSDGKTAKSMRILSFNKNKKFVFLGTELDIVIEKNTVYPIEIIFNSERNTATLKIDGKIIVDSYSVSTSSSQLDGLDMSYFLDEAGVKHTLPYTGFVKSYLCDADGRQITDADGNFIFVDKLVARKNFYTDMIRLCQGATGSTTDYYLDDIKAERIEPEVIFSTDFTGWENFTPTKQNTDYRFEDGNATLVNDGENTYVKLAKSTSQQYFYSFGDRDLKYYGKDVYFETKVKFVTKSEEAGSKTSFISFTEQRNSSGDPFYYDNSTPSTTTYRHFLSRDEHGYLYTSNNTEPIGQLKYQDWTNIGIYIHGNGTKWVSYDVYIDGEFVTTNTLAIAGDVQTYSFRFRAQYNEMWFDDFAVYYPKAEIEDLEIDFESKANVEEAIVKLDGGWKHRALDSTRTNTDGETVTTVQLLGEDGSKYLRVDHTKLRDSTTAYIDAVNDLFIDSKDYLIETAIRFTSETGATLNVAEVYRPMDKQSAPILAVRGDTNYMYVILRGVTYDLVSKDGTPIVAAGINDSEFTKVAILVDSVNDTYSVYVNGIITYYNYNQKRLPCADMPLHFVDKETDGTKDKVRLLELSQYKYQDAILDVDYLNLVSLANGIGSEIKGTQTKSVTADESYSVRFVSGIDTLYGAAIGYEFTAVYTDKNGSDTSSYDKNSNLVFEKVTSDEGDITAASLGASYLAAIEVITIPMETEVEFTVKPYVSHGGVKIYGESYTVKFSQGAIVE